MAPTPLSVAQFLDAVRSSRLLTPQELTAAVASASEKDREASPALAAALVRQGKLTTFQARKLLAGITRGMVLGPYRIMAPLGKGGMAKVYLARDTRADRLVALKVMPPHWAREEERLLLRFRREMDLCNALTHPSVAHAYEAGVDGDVHYIALEYVPGVTLSKSVSTGGPLPADVAARVFAEAADGLAHAHERGLIHRDIKPSNIMITPAGHAKLLDLGLALRPGEEGDATVIGGKGYVVGTMDYVSPEQTRNAATVDFRTDLYSLGGTLFYALTGRPPFPGGTSLEKIKRQREESPPRVEEYNMNVPAGLCEIVHQLLSKKTDDRPATAIAVRDRLRKWAAPAVGPDNPGDTQRILAAITSNPTPEEDPSELPTRGPRDWSVWFVVLAGVVVGLALVVLVAWLMRT